MKSSGQVSYATARSSKKSPAASPAATGSVVTHATRMPAMVLSRACRVTVPMPNNEPQATWVVDTGRSNLDAPMTSALSLRPLYGEGFKGNDLGAPFADHIIAEIVPTS